MKICVFAHVPPPMHGQAYMTQLLLQALRQWKSNDPEAPEIYHVDARVSRKAQDIGGMAIGKLLLLVGYITQAVWARLWRRCTHLYYVPAPAKKSAILRDLLVLSVLRPFYPHLILHWHAMGLGKWVSGQTTIFWGHLDGYSRKCIRKLLCGAEQAWILKEVFREEVQIFQPKRVELLINGIPDLFPNYSEGLGSQRKARAHQLRLLNEKSNHIGTVRFLHLGLCSREKGIFLELEFLRRWTEIFPENPPKLRMCGVFDSKETEAQFRAATAALDVECIGAVDGAEKKHALQNADVLLFFSQLPETMGLVVVEAMSAGLLPFVAKGNNIESILERADLCAIDLLSPLEGVRRAVKEYNPDRLRALFVEHYIVSVFALRVRKALSESQL